MCFEEDGAAVSLWAEKRVIRNKTMGTSGAEEGGEAVLV